jgi:hypothetical protein
MYLGYAQCIYPKERMARGYTTMLDVAPTPKFLLRLPADLRADLDRIAEREHRTVTNLIVHALREWLAGRGRVDQARRGSARQG